MDTWMKEKYSWIIEEKKAIKKYILDLEKTFIGICLGCQFLQVVLGEKIKKEKFQKNTNILCDKVFRSFYK